MSLTLTAAALAVLTLSTHTDTTLAVSPGTRLELENFGGDISVSAWARNAVRIEAEHGSRTRITIDRGESELVIRAVGHMGAAGSVDFSLSVPAWMALQLSGVYTDVTVEGTRADVSAETVRGDVHVSGGKGVLTLQSVEGDVELENTQGRAELTSVNADVHVVNHEGDLTAQTVNGDVELENVRSGAVEASTVNGGVTFEGEIRGDGRYHFATHNGDVDVVLPPEPSVAVSVSTYSGEFDSSFPVRLTGARRGKRFKFTLGTGSAEMELESFQGAIHLYKNGDRELEELRDRVKENENQKEMKHERKLGKPDRKQKHGDKHLEEGP